jgi:hypothetical protein
MKRILLSIVSIVILLAAAAQGERARVSYIFMHRSVGLEAVTGCFYPYNRNIRSVLDTMTVFNGADTARIVFRSYNLNYGVLGDTCLSDTVWYGDCWEDYNNLFRGYDWELQEREKMIIYPPGNYSPTLLSVFQFPDKENQIFWNVFREHQIPYPGGVYVSEKYDLVMVKPPYIVWRDPSPARMDSLRSYYRAVRDSVANHPEINFCFVFGTPLCLDNGGLDSFRGDTVAAHLVYNAASWFASDSFFTHTTDGPYRNVWKIDTYTPLCETSPDSANRYCLKNAYWAGYSYQSHLSAAGALAMQDTLISFIRRATLDILIQRGGGENRPSRGEIDRKIKEFRDGTATLPEVLDLIERYNSGG